MFSEGCKGLLRGFSSSRLPSQQAFTVFTQSVNRGGNRSKAPDQKPPGQKTPGQKLPDNKPPRIIEEIIA